MSRRNPVYSPAISSLALLVIVGLSAVFGAQPLANEFNMNSIAAAPQKGPGVVAGAPLKGCDVKLGKPPGGSPAARTTTDGKGKFDFGVVPKGSYYLTLDLPDEKSLSNPAATTRGADSSGGANACLITVDGVVGGQISRGWDPKNKKPIELNPKATAKTTGQDKIIVESDGQTPLTGSVQWTIVKSKSNIRNN